ncbi:MAG: TetR/AcrR family transcriptional regulator [Candidatus Latescibacteria bacterium]|nr:TetR/AcrR family transcriptional regulator [Candidatus Latescibacterota bacterium]
MAVHATEEARRAQILEAAKRCFARQGYHETKVDDIVREAGLSKGALYWYFKSKVELLDALCDSFAKELQEDFLKGSAGKTLDPEYLICELGAMLMERVLNDPEHRLIWMEHWSMASRDPKSQQKLNMVHQGWLDLIVPLLQKNIKEGKLKPMDPRQLAMGLMALFDGILIHQALRDLDALALWRSTARMLLDGVEK